ncbi:olfactory receptor 13C9-like [Discoglossus pictus]
MALCKGAFKACFTQVLVLVLTCNTAFTVSLRWMVINSKTLCKGFTGTPTGAKSYYKWKLQNNGKRDSQQRNGIIILAVTIDHRLNTPMYFFLRNLSFLEICFISDTAPKALEIFVSVDKSITFFGCAVQMFVFLSIAVTECVFLGLMAFDRYIAICNPLRYISIVNRNLCHLFIAGSWMVGVIVSLGRTTFVFRLPFCGPNHIAHFFCDIPPLLNIACVDTFYQELVSFVACIIGAVIPFLLIICSYIKILSSVLLIQSVDGRRKAFSTCVSHLVSVVIFYGTAMFVHLRLRARSSGNDRMTSLFYCFVIPAINPLIYSLRNKDMRTALRKLTLRVPSV